MPIKVYHPEHGFVLTNNQEEINMLVAKGGKVVVKNRDIKAPIAPVAPIVAKPTITNKPK